MTETTIRTITAQDVRQALEQVVGQRGAGYVYPTAQGAGSCHYRWDGDDVASDIATAEQIGQPACIAGAIFDQWGILDEAVPPRDEGDGVADYYRMNEEPVNTLADLALDGVIDFTSGAIQMLAEAQGMQDAKKAWGVAAAEAIRRADENGWT